MALRRLPLVLLAAAVLATLLVVGGAADAPAAPNQFVTMSDGVEIAINVLVPEHCNKANPCPTLFEINGYDGGSAEDGTLAVDFGIPALQGDSRQLSRRFNDQYVTVHASARGTGCSGGEFDLFSWRAALDGKEIIDDWIPAQEWSNGDVALMGHSYGGITGFMVAATQPEHLRAATLSGLIDDLFRGLVYPGGVSNYGFPVLWTVGIRTAYDVAGGIAPGIVREEEADDVENRRARWGANVARKSRTVTNDPVVQGTEDTDNDWWRARALATYAERIKVPLHITGAYQDEQTGPRGPTRLWELATASPRKRLLLTNGDHNTQNPSSTGPEVWGDRKAFIDHYLLGTAYDEPPVTVLFEYHRNEAGELVSNARVDADDFPLPQTDWQEWYLQPDGAVAPTSADAGTLSYAAGSPRQGWSYQAGPTRGSPFTTADGPDQLVFSSEPFDTPQAIAGPMTATLHLATTAPDTELFVSIVDIDDATGARTYLQRGMLKASHRAVDVAASDKLADGRIYRPHRPHTNPTTVVAGEVVEYLVEIFPVGHVFRPGHRLGVIVQTPPLVDSYYVYVPTRVPSVNTLHMGSATPSRILVPFVPGVTPAGDPLPCGAQEAVRCIASPNG